MSCNIYGKETVKYTYNLIDDDAAVVSSSLDWVIADTLVDGSDNTTSIADSSVVDTQNKVYESSGVKSVNTEVNFDDGWSNVYVHQTALDVTAMVYEEPILELTWDPVEPTIEDIVTFTQDHISVRDLVTAKGRIDNVTVDHYNDGALEETALAGTDQFTYQYSTKEDGIGIKLVAQYWDGYEDQTVELLKTIDMSNIPPVADYARVDNGVCVPAYVWTATTSDLDDDDTTLVHSWLLYEVIDGNSSQLTSGAGVEFSYPFQYEGSYKLVLKSTDAEGDWSEKEDLFDITFSECSSSGGVSGSGIIRLESDRFEMVSVPVEGRTVAGYFIAKLEEVTGKAAIESIDFVKAYPSNSVSNGKYVGFVPGVTNPASSNNFNLVEDDNGSIAHVPFFVRTKVLEAPIEIPWDTGDAI